MHFEILIEDSSGEKMLNILMPKIISEHHTYKIHSYRGIGRLPSNLRTVPSAKKRFLLSQLPKLLNGYGKTFSEYPPNYQAAVIVVCDLDKNDYESFYQELLGVLNGCDHKPETRFCIAVEEGEAWLLGDMHAIKTAFPQAKLQILNAYVNDSICGTWELLANAVSPGGEPALSKKGWQAVGKEKSCWAEKITPHMVISTNKSPSFQNFFEQMNALIRGENEMLSLTG